ncbi:MAG: tetratricopeptide repeat protein [Chitinispirillales bacterium]|jgi:TolA-binding protein|nr:tetratricopeptide repeat protein [Chitinispirillales bacterium]
MKTKRAACSIRVVSAIVLLGAVFAFGQDGEGGYDAPYFQADFTQDLNSWTSALVNPALLYRVNQMHASMAFYRWGLDRGNMGYQDFSFFYPVRLNHTVGLTILHARNSVEKVGRESDGEASGTVSYQDLWLIGNYGVRVLPWLMLGSNVKLRTQTQFGASAVSRVPGLDVGVYINPLDHYQYGDIGISLNAQDILPTQTPWEKGVDDGPDDFYFKPTPSDLITVSRARMGLRYSGLNDNLVASFEVLIDNAFRDIFAALPWNKFREALLSGVVNQDSIKALTKDIAGMFPTALRWGFHVKYMFIPQIWFKGGWTNNNIPYLGFNYNLIYPLPEMINYLNIDYNFGYSFLENSASMDDERGLVMMLRASADFGRTREQKESKRLYDRLVVAPMDVYQQAMRLYTAGKYWEASFAYGKLMSLYPTFYLNDKAVYYMGDCYKELYMNNTAREVFRDALEEYTTSDMRANYLYGVMSIDYREDNYDEAMRNHSFIINLYPESEIVGEAEYLAGEIEFARGHEEAAREHFEKVKPTDKSYLYALYTLSVIHYHSDREQAAIQNLRRIVDDTTSRKSDDLLQNAAAVKLGHIYFESQGADGKGKLREAVEAYSMVHEGASPSGDEALLGTAWAWVKAGQPQLAYQKVDKIIALHPKSPFVPEAHLLRGYSLMLQKRYSDAVPAFEKCLETASNGKFLTADDVTTRKVQYDGEMDTFAPTADKIRKNAMRKPTPRSVEERPELQKGYERFAREHKEFFDYRMLEKSHRNFFMQKEQIIEDATFALAKATNMIKSRRVQEEMQKSAGTEGKIDAEIEKLRRQLEESGE